MNRTLFSLFVFCTSLLFLSGCEQLNTAALKSVVKEPAVSVENFSVTGFDLDSVALSLKLKVDNPNNYALALSGYDYEVGFNGRKFFDGSTDEGFKVPALASSVVEVPLTIGFSQIMKMLKEMGDDNQLKYNVKTNMRLDAPVLNLFAIKADKDGAVTVPKVPEVSFGNLEVKKLSLSQVNFALAMKVTNPNNFGLTLKDIDYNINQGGKSLFSGAIDQAINIAENQTSTVSIPVSIELGKISAGLIKSLTSGSFSGYSLDANVTVDSGLPALKNLKFPIHYQP